jgi:hypothetical protein
MAGKVRAKKLIRLSAARAKIRFGYASGFEVCFSGFAAGVVIFVISVAAYFPAAVIRVQSTVSEAIIEKAGALAKFFGIRLLDRGSISSAILNLAVISAVFGAVGAIAGIMLRLRVRKEPSASFFAKRMRLPLDVLPFVAFFAYAAMFSAKLPAVYVAAALVATFLWRFWHRIILSVVSSLDVDRFMPRPIRKK